MLLKWIDYQPGTLSLGDKSSGIKVSLLLEVSRMKCVCVNRISDSEDPWVFLLSSCLLKALDTPKYKAPVFCLLLIVEVEGRWELRLDNHHFYYCCYWFCRKFGI